MHKVYLIIAILLTITLTIGSLIPPPNIVLVKVNNVDKLIHLLAYCLLTFSWIIALQQQLKKEKVIYVLAFSIFVFGIVIEVLQGVLTPYRQADYVDVIANFLGITLAILLFKRFFLKHHSN